MSLRPTLEFLLYDWLHAEDSDVQRERFADHSRETFDAVLETRERSRAREIRAVQPHVVDIEEPVFRRREGDPGRRPRMKRTRRLRCSGMLSAAGLRGGRHAGAALHHRGGGQRLLRPGLGQYLLGALTKGNANLLLVHGTEMQKAVFASNEFGGRFTGTMCLSEPQAGSSLSDITTRAVPDGAGFGDDPLGPRYLPLRQQDVDLGR